MNAVDLLALTLNVYAEPGDVVSISVSVPASYESGTWVGKLWTGPRRGNPVALFTVTPPSSSPVILKLDTALVVASWALEFEGYWELERTAGGETRTWVKGDFILDPTRRQTL